jgi:hypothetical protein
MVNAIEHLWAVEGNCGDAIRFFIQDGLEVEGVGGCSHEFAIWQEQRPFGENDGEYTSTQVYKAN